MSDQPRIFTSRFHAVSEFATTGLRPGFVPCRISLGVPRTIIDAKAWPYIEELAPRGAFGIEDEQEFETVYLNRLDRIGVDRIEARFRSIIRDYPGQPLALLCFEDVTVPKNWCHRTLFAEWWSRETGEVLEERNSAEELPVSGWEWTPFGWARSDASDRPPVQLTTARRTA